MNPVLDIHRHGISSPGAVTAFDISDSLPATPFPISVALHPWNSSGDTLDTLDTLADRLFQAASSPSVVAVGETGVDRLRGASVDVQSVLFATHVGVADSLGLPVVIHCVRAVDVILGLHRSLRPSTPWVVHGFRGNAETARQLVRAGIFVSFGPRFNPMAAAAVDPGFILAETDDSPGPISGVIAAVARARNVTSGDMTRLIQANTSRFLGL